jgi:hypothetical protein
VGDVDETLRGLSILHYAAKEDDLIMTEALDSYKRCCTGHVSIKAAVNKQTASLSYLKPLSRHFHVNPFRSAPSVIVQSG